MLHNGIFNQKTKTMKSLLTTLLLFSFLLVFGQKENHANCETAQEVFDKKTITVEKMSVNGKEDEKISQISCFASELIPDVDYKNLSENIYWLTWECSKSGTLEFLITPNEQKDDIDFVVFAITDFQKSCTDKKIIRCMAMGDNEYPSPCLGVTGLKKNETAEFKNVGCQKGNQTNFLKELNMKEGEIFFLGLINVSSKSGFSIKFNGDGLIGNENPEK